jgi:hypothetical protein
MGLFPAPARVRDRFCKSGLLAPREPDLRACRPTSIQARLRRNVASSDFSSPTTISPRNKDWEAILERVIDLLSRGATADCRGRLVKSGN